MIKFAQYSQFQGLSVLSKTLIAFNCIRGDKFMELQLNNFSGYNRLAVRPSPHKYLICTVTKRFYQMLIFYHQYHYTQLYCW